MDITVPAGKTLYLADGGTLTSDVAVTGKLVVFGGTFTPGAHLTGAGTLDVEAGGILTVTDDALFTGSGKLGAVNVTKWASLTTSATVDTAAKVTAWLGYAGKGRLTLTVTGITPSATLAAIGSPPAIEYGGYSLPAVKVTNNVDETALTFTVPAGVRFTTTGTLGTVAALTVNGGLDAGGATLASAGASITLGSKGQADLGNVKLLADVTVPAGAGFQLGAGSDFNTHIVTFTKGRQDIISDIDLAFSGIGAGGWTLAGDIALTAGQSIVIPASTTVIVQAGNKITNGGTIVLAPTASLVLATPNAITGGAKIEGAGSLIAGATAITGAWEAVGTTTAASTVTILSAATGATITAATNATGLKAGAVGATITQAAGASENALTIAAATAINLAGTTSAALGTILLTANTNPGNLSLTATSKILIGAGTGGSNASAITTITIGGKSVTSSGFATADYKTVGSDPLNLVQIGGTTAGTLKASTTSGNDVSIASNSAFTGT